MKAFTKHHIIIGDCTKAIKILDLPAIDLLVTSPPYFNAPFDYEELFNNYESFLKMMLDFGTFYFQVLKPHGILSLNIDDMLIKRVKYPIISDTIKIMSKIGYNMKGKIIWRKPEGYIRISRRSGVLLQNPYPMYYYPDNLLEAILIFQKPSSNNSLDNEKIVFEDIWEITNVLPLKGRLETDIAAFPDELPHRLIKIFTKKGSWVCDPFLGSGTTMKVSRELRRNSIGVEILGELVPIIKKKSGFVPGNLTNYFDSDQLIIDKIQTDEEKIESNIDISLLHNALEEKKTCRYNYKHHLLLLDCRNMSKSALNNKFSDLINQLYPGRILIVLFNPSYNLGDRITLYQITDYVMRHGLRFRDKITVQHKPEKQWDVITQYSSKIVFNHCYYEVLIFQKGKFDYKSKTKKEKEDCTINKNQYQKEKWYLVLWEFKNLTRKKCDSIVTKRLIELFLFNDEIVSSNISQISCLKRRFDLHHFILN